MEEISEKAGSSFESILEYRQRTGKTKESLGCEDYAEVALKALTAAGFDVDNVIAQASFNNLFPGKRFYEVVVRLTPSNKDA